MSTPDFSADVSTIGKINLSTRDTSYNKNSNYEKITSTIASLDDVDWIKVTLIGGLKYGFELDNGYPFSGKIDIWMNGISPENLPGPIWDTIFLDPYCALVWDDPQPGAHSFYIHVAAGWSGSRIGAYTVTVQSFNKINYEEATNKQYALNNCTSYVAWRVSDYNNKENFPSRLGNANTWDTNSQNLYNWKVDKTPCVGDIAQTDSGQNGHVAFVEGVEKDSNGNVVSIDISEYNYGKDEKYGERANVPISKFTSYIHPYNYDQTVQNVIVKDGYLSHALVWVDTNDNGHRDWTDANGNGVWDTGEGESWTLTDGNGHATGLIGWGTLRVSANPLGGTIDISTGKAFTGSYSALSGSTIIDPLTTLIVASEGDTDVVKTALGLDVDLDLFTYDPLAALSLGGTASNEAMAIKTQSAATQMGNLLQIVTSINLAAGVNAGCSDISASLANVLIAATLDNPTGTIDLADSTVLKNAIISTAQHMVTDTATLTVITNHAGAIADALALVNMKIENVSDAADALALSGQVVDVACALTNIVSTQIIVQETLANQAAQVILADSNAPITLTSGNIDVMISAAASGVGQIFVPVEGTVQANHAPTGEVNVLGMPMEHLILHVDNLLSDVDGLGEVSYQWHADGMAISGATSERYTLTASEVGKTITVLASYTDKLGHAESVSSAATLAIVEADADHPLMTPMAHNGVNVDPERYSGPATAAGGETIHFQFLGDSTGEVLIGTGNNDFINVSAGDDAVNAGAGNDVIDGGLDSNFLTGGSGTDIFFSDGRGGGITWSTITDWQAGEQLSVWGWKPGVSKILLWQQDGAEGYKGITMHADLDGNGEIDTSVTFTGITSQSQLPTPLEFADPALLWFK